MTPPTSSDGAPQILRGVVTSLPVILNLDNQQATLPPGVFVIYSADANLRGRVEISCDRPDEHGNLPLPGIWVDYSDFNPEIGGFIVGSQGNGITTNSSSTPHYSVVLGEQLPGDALGLYAKLQVTATAIRVRITNYIAGTVTFAVTQATIPKLRGL